MFKNTMHQQLFSENGFVKFPLLGNEDLIQLWNGYHELAQAVEIKNSPYGMYASIEEKDYMVKERSMRFLQSVLEPALQEHFVDFKVHLGSFLVKLPNEHSYTFPHQDWTFVDDEEPNVFSATIWISLEDIEPVNGSLGFVKGSHKFLTEIVGSPSPANETGTTGHEALLFSYSEFPSVKAGDAIMFNNKCVHAANPNRTSKPRVAVGIGVTPNNAELYHYYRSPVVENTLLKLKVEDDFFLHYMNNDLLGLYHSGGIPGKCKVEKEIPLKLRTLTKEEMLNNVVGAGNVRNKYVLNLPGYGSLSEVESDGVLAEASSNGVVEALESPKLNVEEITLESSHPPMELDDSREPQDRGRSDIAMVNQTEKQLPVYDSKGGFWQTYTPVNILKEIRFRITGK